MTSATQNKLPPSSQLPAPVQTFVFWKWPLRYLKRQRRHYGSRFTLHAVSHPPLVFLSDPEDIKAVFTAPPDVLHPGNGADTLRPIVGDQSFMLSEGNRHLAGRKTILPAFHDKVVQQHANLVTSIARREIESWPRDTPFALHPHLLSLTLQVILHTTVGAPTGIGDKRLDALRDKLLAMLAITAGPVISEPLLRAGPGRPKWKRFLQQINEVDQLLFALIEDRRRITDCGNDILTMLLAARNADGSAMSTRQIRDSLMSVIVAGHETTASELAWAFQLLVHNPAALDKLTSEIDRDISQDYLTATVHEILRHRPVFLFTIPRSVMQPVDIGGWKYCPPAQLLGCIYLVHHDPQIYPAPHDFRPERFLEGAPRTYTWLPWGGGRKRCPGLHLATLEMKIVLRTVLSIATICPASQYMEHAHWRSVIVTPHAGSRIVLRRRPRRSI